MNVILFDGVCNWCNGTVNWIIAHDKKNNFKFSPLQSSYARQKVAHLGLGHQYLDTIILLENEKVYLRSAAVLRIFREMGGIYKLAYIFILIPAPILDFFYNIVAKYRYTWFGKRDSCRVPEAGLKDKFID
jgi:predicted DCC family thiol-disulfide oxidoreductase YuxK